MANFSGGRGFGDRRDNRDRRGGNDRGRGRSGGGRSFGGGGRRGGLGNAYGEEKKMYDTICDNCGKECQVPFRPTGEKPVYCSDCFEEMNGGGREFRDDFAPRKPRREFSDEPKHAPSVNTKELEEMMLKLDKKLDLVVNLLEIISKKKTVRVKMKKKEE